MEIEFCDLKKQYTILKDKIDLAIKKVLEHRKFINGPEITELESKLASFVGVKHAIGVSSGTSALHASLLAYGIKEGDYIITTPFTFIASAETIAILGATPLFIDIDSKTYNLDPEKLKEFLENPIDPLTKEGIPRKMIKGIIPIDMFGQSADYEELKGIAKDNNLFLLEDGAQSFGAEYKEKKACSFGDVAVTSFFPSKPLGCYGDGGMVFTDDDALAEKIRMLINHGQKDEKIITECDKGIPKLFDYILK